MSAAMTTTSSRGSNKASSSANAASAVDEADVAVGTEAEGDPLWGRLMFTGGIDFPVLGRKDKPGNPDFPDASTPTLVRPTSHVKFTKIFTSHSSSHCVAIDVAGQAYLFGRNANSQLGMPNPADGTPAIFPPVKLSGVPALCSPRKIVAAATGRNHTLLVNDRGEVWAAGQNAMGQCGQSNLADVSRFRRVEGPLLKEKVVMASAGVNFSLVLTTKGRVYAFGSPEKGQLGNGRTGEYIAASKSVFMEQPEPLFVKALEKRRIVKIASGQQHSLALDSEGFVHSWGFGGLGRLGHGAQVDLLLPKVIPHFAGANVITRATNICCGATNSMVVDGQKMAWLFGKWKTSGDGSAGQPWMTPKIIQDVMGHKVSHIAAGAVTLFCIADEEGKNAANQCTITIGWGQNANNGELGLGVGQPRSATKPTRISTLDGIEIMDVAAAQNTTYFLARPPAAFPPTEADLNPAAAAPAAPTGNASGEYFFNPFADPPPAEAESAAAAGLSAGASPAPEDVGTPKGSAAAGSGTGVDAEKPARRSRTDADKWAEIPKFPNAFEATEICLVCGVDDGEPLECDKCSEPIHLQCLDPPLDSVPLGEWFCPPCLDKPLPNPASATPARGKAKGKPKAASAAKVAPAPALAVVAAANGKKRKAEDVPAAAPKRGKKKA